MRIAEVTALEVLDSRGNPTVQADVRLTNGIRASAQVPSGASTGAHEAPELRDGDPARFAGKGVLKAVQNAETILGPAVAGADAADQREIDRRLLACGPGMGANATLAVSCAVARAAAMARGIPLWKHLAGDRIPLLPVPMINIISGGLHAGRNLEFQDFLVIPRGYGCLAESLSAVVKVHRKTHDLLAARGCLLTGVADEGGWGPRLETNEAAVALLREAIGASGERMDIALDVASTHFFSDGIYRLEGKEASAVDITDLLGRWIDRYGVVSIEDPLAEDDWAGWKLFTTRLGRKAQIIGDDLFTTNIARLNRGIDDGAANAVLVKMNQIGTLTQTFEVIDRAREAGYKAVMSARSGETEDSFLADLAVASGAGQIKVGSITRSERLAKYNRLLEIEQREL